MARRPALTTRAAILGLVLGALVLALAYPFQQWLSQRAQMARASAGIADERLALHSLTRALVHWRDRAYVERQAELRLHETFPGRQIYLVLGPDRRHPVRLLARHGRATVPLDPGAPWYRQLWASDTSAGG